MRVLIRNVLAASLGYFGTMFLLACHPKPPKPQIEIVIPQGCITSDVVCTQINGKQMDCKFDKFTACEVIRPIKKENPK